MLSNMVTTRSDWPLEMWSVQTEMHWNTKYIPDFKDFLKNRKYLTISPYVMKL